MNAPYSPISPDRIEGVIYGQAIGDARGLPMEFRSAAFIHSSAHKWGYQDVWRNLKLAWKAGEFSDDTERAIALLDGYLTGRDEGRSELLNPDELICIDRLVRWLETDARGAGNLTIKVLTNALCLVDPFRVSREAWEETNGVSAPNGAVMGTSYVGIMRPWDLDWTEMAAEHCARLTHWDLRCVSGSVAVSVLIAGLVSGLDPWVAVEEATSRAEKYDPNAREFLRVWDISVESLELDEGLPENGSMPRVPVPIGYTWKCARAAFWAFHQLDRDLDPVYIHGQFLPILDQILSAGGDTDTNGAVAAAVLGAAMGRGQIPEEAIDGLAHKSRLDTLLSRLARYHDASREGRELEPLIPQRGTLQVGVRFPTKKVSDE